MRTKMDKVVGGCKNYVFCRHPFMDGPFKDFANYKVIVNIL